MRTDRARAARLGGLALAALVACGSPDPLARARDQIVGEWQQLDATSALFVRARFRRGGVHELELSGGARPAEAQAGRWRLSGTADRMKLEICRDGAACDGGGLWWAEEVFVGRDVLTTKSASGGPPTHWQRVE